MGEELEREGKELPLIEGVRTDDFGGLGSGGGFRIHIEGVEMRGSGLEMGSCKFGVGWRSGSAECVF